MLYSPTTDLMSTERLASRLGASGPPARLTGGSDAERRQLTVLFADLVGSTSLMEKLGAEDYSELLSVYHTICNEVVRGGGGVIAQFLGDGIVCYFGYPHAAENDAIRAVTTSINFLRKIKAAQLPFEGVEIQTRIGIATGSVVFGGEKNHFGDDAVGACLNKAARLEGLAETGTALICADTRKLVGKHFDFVEKTSLEMKGFEGTQSAFKVLNQRAGVSYRFESLRARSNSLLVGRSNEMDLLIDRVEKAKQSEAQFMVLSAIAGLGKSKLISMFKAREAVENCRTFMLQCTPEHSNTALHPVKTYLEWVAGVSSSDAPQAVHEKLYRLFTQVWRFEGDDLNHLLDLLSPVGSGTPPDEAISVPLKRRMMFATLCEAVFKFAEATNAQIFIVEDTHWIDPSTTEFLNHLREMSRGRNIFILVTSRPEGRFVAENQDSEDLLRLTPLGESDSIQLVQNASAGADLPDETIAAILKKSEGVPLFIEEYVDLAQTARKQGRSLDLDSIPLTMNSIVQSKLDDLDPNAKRFVQAASALGRNFDIRTVKRVAALEDEPADRVIEDLISKNLAVTDDDDSHGHRFIFSHALIRDAVYASLNRRPREKLHSAIATHLSLDESTNPVGNEIIAGHLLAAGRLKDAANRYLDAVFKAVGRGNAGEALGHLERGISTTEKMQKGRERDKLELRFRTIQAPVQMVTGGPGNPAFGVTLNQAKSLLERLDSRENIVPVVYNYALHNWAISNLDKVDEVVMELERLDSENPDDSSHMAYHTMRGLVAWHKGRNAIAKQSFEQTIERYDPSIHRDIYNVFLKEFGVFARFYLGLTETVLGNFDAGRSWAEQATRVAQTVERPHALGFSLLANFATAMLEGDVDRADLLSQESFEFSSNQGFPEFAAMSQFCMGWVCSKRGDFDKGLPLMKLGADTWDATGFATWQPIFAALQAPLLVEADELDEAQTILDKYDLRVEETGEQQALSPLHTARAVLENARGNKENAESLLEKARQIAIGDEAGLWLNYVNEAALRFR